MKVVEHVVSNPAKTRLGGSMHWKSMVKQTKNSEMKTAKSNACLKRAFEKHIQNASAQIIAALSKKIMKKCKTPVVWLTFQVFFVLLKLQLQKWTSKGKCDICCWKLELPIEIYKKMEGAPLKPKNATAQKCKAQKTISKIVGLENETQCVKRLAIGSWKWVGCIWQMLQMQNPHQK